MITSPKQLYICPEIEKITTKYPRMIICQLKGLKRGILVQLAVIMYLMLEMFDINFLYLPDMMQT